MGGATTAIGFLPGYERVGVLAPALLVLMRLLQGFAIGGEYGGAAIFVAENVPDGERGYYTSYVQVTATLGLFMSDSSWLRRSGTISTRLTWPPGAGDCRSSSRSSCSVLRVGCGHSSGETPLWERLQLENRLAPSRWSRPAATGGSSHLASLRGDRRSGRHLVHGAVLLPAVHDQAGRRSAHQGALILATALLCAMPFFVVFGALSDQIGRKRLMVVGNLLAAISFFPSTERCRSSPIRSTRWR